MSQADDVVLSVPGLNAEQIFDLSYFLVSSCLLVFCLDDSFPVFLIFHVVLGQLSFFASQGVPRLNLSHMLRLVTISFLHK